MCWAEIRNVERDLGERRARNARVASALQRRLRGVRARAERKGERDRTGHRAHQ